MSNITMNAKDSISAKLAECFITVDGNRYNFMQMINFEASFERRKASVPILGRTAAGNKSTGWSGRFRAVCHYNQSIFRELMLRYKNSGEDAYFEIQVSNEDPTSAAGRQTIVYTGCNIDGGILSKFDAKGDYLDEEINGTFEDFSMPEKFALLDGMV